MKFTFCHSKVQAFHPIFQYSMKGGDDDMNQKVYRIQELIVELKADMHRLNIMVEQFDEDVRNVYKELGVPMKKDEAVNEKIPFESRVES